MASRVDVDGTVGGRHRRWAMAWALAALLSACGGGGGGSGGTSATAQGSTGSTGSSNGSGSAAPVTGAPSAPAAPTITSGFDFSFSLPAARTTSAGVFAADGRLVRTLWRAERLAAGAYTRHWDQKDDAGQALADDNYTVRVVHHDVQYVWEGVIGSGSARAGTTRLHRSLYPVSSFVTVPGGMLYATGYNEGQSALGRFTLAAPQVNTGAPALVDQFVSPAMITSDGTRLYWASTGDAMARSTFVAAIDLATGTAARFAAGSAVCLNRMSDGSCYAAQTHDSVLDFHAAHDHVPTGLAVQRDGRLLAVADAADQQVRLFDKTSGSLLGSFTAPLQRGLINQIAFAPGGDLWLVTGDGLQRWTALESAPRIAATAAGLQNGLALAVDPQDADGVWVADGGSSQQLKRFDRAGVLRQTIGRSGGQALDVSVSNDRFSFRLSDSLEQAALGIDEQHRLWVADTGNNRVLNLARDGSLVQQLSWMPISYAATVDSGDPTRVFSNLLEFRVDYARGINDPGAWTLVRNWAAAVPAALRTPELGNYGWSGLRSVSTLANGRTYALIGVNHDGSMVELTAAGGIRLIGPVHAMAAGESEPVFYENGDIGWARHDGSRETVLRQTLQGFDANGNPQWQATPVVLASAPAPATSPAWTPGAWAGLNGPRFPVTSTGKVVYLNTNVDAGSLYHLGAVAKGGSDWLFQVSANGPLDGLGGYQTHRDDTSLQYGGNQVHAIGRQILYGYHGEAFTDLASKRIGQANQFMHFRDDGLFIGQFGVKNLQGGPQPLPGQAGNAFASTLVVVGGRTYLYHNDESVWGGVHRWRVDGLDDIQELTATARTGSVIGLF